MPKLERNLKKNNQSKKDRRKQARVWIAKCWENENYWIQKNLEPFIQIIKDVCIKASQQGVYIDKDNRRIINGYIYIFEARDRDGDYVGTRYSCNAYTLKKRHLFKEDEYNIIVDSCSTGANITRYLFIREKYQKLFLDIIKEQISEISLGKERYTHIIPGHGEQGVSFARAFSIAFWG